MPTPLTRAPVKGYSNWGSGVQPERRTTAELNATAPRQSQTVLTPAGDPDAIYKNVGPGQTNRFGGRNLGTLSSEGLNRPGEYPLSFSAKPRLSQAPLQGSAYSEYRPPIPRTGLTRAPQPQAAPDIDGMTPGSFEMQNTLNNAGVYEPDTFGAENAEDNDTGYRAPQQTERANPLTGDNNGPMESVTTRVSPFSQRGNAAPRTQDAMIGGSGPFRRSFGNQESASQYDSFVRRLFSNT